MTAKTLTATALSLLDMRILKEILLVSGGQYLGAGMSLLATIWAAHVLTVRDFGLLSIFVATMTLTTEITGKSLDWGIVRFSSFYLDQAPMTAHALIKRVFVLRFLISFFVCAAGFLSAALLARRLFQNPDYSTPIALGFVGSVGMSMWGYGQAILQAYQRFGLHGFISFANGFAKLAGMFVLVYLGLCHSQSVEATYVIIAFATLVLAVRLMPKDFLRTTGIEAGLMRKFVHFTKWPFVANVFVILYTHLSFFLLLYFSGPAEVAVYSSAWRLVFALDLLAYSLVVVFLPKASRITNTSDFVAYAVQTLKISLPMCVLLVPLVFHSRTIMTVLYPDQYVSGTRMLQVLLAGTLVSLPAHPISLVMFAANRPRVFAFAALATLVFSLIGGLLVIPTYAGLGAALVAASTKALYGVLLLIFSYLSMRKTATAIAL